MKTTNQLFKLSSLSIIWFWLITFAFIPIFVIFCTSFLTSSFANIVIFKFTLKNYLDIINPIYLRVFLHSFFMAGASTLICLVIGYPFAYFIAKGIQRYRPLFLMLVIIPFWTSSLIRTYAILTIFKTKGILNTLLLGLGIIHHPLDLLYTDISVFVGLTYNLLPFMILPLYANIEKLDDRLIEAAHDLGAGKLRTFRKVIIPITIPGIISGVMLVFLPAMTLFYIPTLLGGAKSLLMGNLLENLFLEALNWPLGSAVSVSLIIILGLMLFAYYHTNKRSEQEGRLL